MRTTPRRTARAITALAITATIAITAACTTSQPQQASTTPTAGAASTTDTQALLTQYGYDTTDARQLIDDLDATAVAHRPTGLFASVRPDQLLLSTDDGKQARMPLPDDEFYLSIAPYLNATHECHFHSLTTCRGELANTAMKITVRDAATGKTLIDGAHTTYDNGFIGMWLPRGITAAIDINYEDKHANATIDTAAADSPTCLTTMRLA